MREAGGDGRTRAARTRRGSRSLLGRGQWNFLEMAAAPVWRAWSRGRDGARGRELSSPRGTGPDLEPPAQPPCCRRARGGRSLPGEGFSGGDGAVSFNNRRSTRARWAQPGSGGASK